MKKTVSMRKLQELKNIRYRNTQTKFIAWLNAQYQRKTSDAIINYLLAEQKTPETHPLKNMATAKKFMEVTTNYAKTHEFKNYLNNMLYFDDFEIIYEKFKLNEDPDEIVIAILRIVELNIYGKTVEEALG